MKFNVIAFLMVSHLSFLSTSGQDSILVYSRCNEIITKGDECRIKIVLKNWGNNSVSISPNPVISDITNGFGDILIDFEILGSSCYETVSVEMNPGSTVFEEYTKLIYPKDSVEHIIDLRNFFPLGKKMYRYRIQYKYLSNGSLKRQTSSWYYFSVIVNKIDLPSKIRLFREEHL